MKVLLNKHGLGRLITKMLLTVTVFSAKFYKIACHLEIQILFKYIGTIDIWLDQEQKTK